MQLHPLPTGELTLPIVRDWADSHGAALDPFAVEVAWYVINRHRARGRVGDIRPDAEHAWHEAQAELDARFT